MFRENKRHKQPALISAVSDLPEKQQSILRHSWAHTFYHEFFSRINEEAFSVLYSDVVSRPNIPVNVLLGLESLKSAFKWSDNDLYYAFCFHVEVRYALGYDRFCDGDFELRTLYNFRERLSCYNILHGINLVSQAFEQITDEQIAKLNVRTGMQRMDSTQIASNIATAHRLSLLVQALQRIERILKDTDKLRLAEVLTPYTKESSEHYVYRIKGIENVTEQLQVVGRTIYALLLDLKVEYANEDAYQILERLFSEHYHLLESGPQVKEYKELTSSCLQSLDDREATYRTKGSEHYRGYVANITETCDPENELQLITKIQVAPNNVDDCHLLVEALPNLKERTDVETMITDGGYGGQATDTALQAQGVNLIQTAIRGPRPDPNKFQLSDFVVQSDAQSKPVSITCPQGQTAPVICTRTGNWQGHFGPDCCIHCPHQLTGRCCAKSHKRDQRYLLAFTSPQIAVAKRRKEYLTHKHDETNLRASIEATVRSLKLPFPAGKLPVRGQFRVTCMVIGSAIMTNVRRIHRFLESRKKPENEPSDTRIGKENSKEQSLVSLFLSVKAIFCHWMKSPRYQMEGFGC
jgi:hypothetical protein